MKMKNLVNPDITHLEPEVTKVPIKLCQPTARSIDFQAVATSCAAELEAANR